MVNDVEWTAEAAEWVNGRGHTRAPFLVLPGGLCVPLEGPFHVDEIRGEFYLLGHCTWERFDTRELADRRLAERARELDPHELAREVVAADAPHR